MQFPITGNPASIRFRIVFGTGSSDGFSNDGVAIDFFHIFKSTSFLVNGNCLDISNTPACPVVQLPANGSTNLNARSDYTDGLGRIGTTFKWSFSGTPGLTSGIVIFTRIILGVLSCNWFYYNRRGTNNYIYVLCGTRKYN